MPDWTLVLPFQVLYVFCVCYAIVTDYRDLRIPNWVTGALAIGFVPYGVLFWNDLDLAQRLIVTAGIFALAFGLFVFDLFGGGDVKLLTAVTLWVGPHQLLLFIFLMAIFGGILALGLILLRRLRRGKANSRLKVPQPVARWLAEGVVPYGLAIGLAALMVAPRIF